MPPSYLHLCYNFVAWKVCFSLKMYPKTLFVSKVREKRPKPRFSLEAGPRVAVVIPQINNLSNGRSSSNYPSNRPDWIAKRQNSTPNDSGNNVCHSCPIIACKEPSLWQQRNASKWTRRHSLPWGSRPPRKLGPRQQDKWLPKQISYSTIGSDECILNPVDGFVQRETASSILSHVPLRCGLLPSSSHKSAGPSNPKASLVSGAALPAAWGTILATLPHFLCVASSATIRLAMTLQQAMQAVSIICSPRRY